MLSVSKLSGIEQHLFGKCYVTIAMPTGYSKDIYELVKVPAICLILPTNIALVVLVNLA